MGGACVLFIDRDGTLIEEPADAQVDALDKLALLPGVVPSLIALRDAGYRFVMVSNQDGLGTPDFPAQAFEQPQRFLLRLLASQGIEFDAVYICPHRASDGCGCRKPAAGLLHEYLREVAIDRARSCVIGDRDTDLELAANLGLPGLRIGPQGSNWPQIAARLCSRRRAASSGRSTRETHIRVEVDLDQAGPVEIATGIGFFDHMLEQLGRHGGIALHVEAEGDLQVDAHHTVEDTALVLGDCVSRALGPRAGIARYGFVLPMDEAQASVVLDLSGRPYCKFDGSFGREQVGGLPTELVGHFFRSFSQALGATVHASVTGNDSHHMIEALFKALGRTLRDAIRIEGVGVPSTKGVL